MKVFLPVFFIKVLYNAKPLQDKQKIRFVDGLPKTHQAAFPKVLRDLALGLEEFAALTLSASSPGSTATVSPTFKRPFKFHSWSGRR